MLIWAVGISRSNSGIMTASGISTDSKFKTVVLPEQRGPSRYNTCLIDLSVSGILSSLIPVICLYASLNILILIGYNTPLCQGVQEISAAQKILDGKELVAVPENQDWLGWIGDIAVNRDHWLSYAFRGFQILNQKGVQVNHFVSIGTGSGIDAIGALEIFRPQTVTVTDLAPAILSRAKENIIRYQQNGGSQARINFGLGLVRAFGR